MSLGASFVETCLKSVDLNIDKLFINLEILKENILISARGL